MFPSCEDIAAPNAALQPLPQCAAHVLPNQFLQPIRIPAAHAVRQNYSDTSASESHRPGMTLRQSHIPKSLSADGFAIQCSTQTTNRSCEIANPFPSASRPLRGAFPCPPSAADRAEPPGESQTDPSGMGSASCPHARLPVPSPRRFASPALTPSLSSPPPPRKPPRRPS